MSLKIALAAITFGVMMAGFLRYVLQKPNFPVGAGHGRRPPSRAWAVAGFLGYVGFIVVMLSL
jgi:hypothetical protein